MQNDNGMPAPAFLSPKSPFLVTQKEEGHCNCHFGLLFMGKYYFSGYYWEDL